jgi:hypothetical protein
VASMNAPTSRASRARGSDAPALGVHARRSRYSRGTGGCRPVPMDAAGCWNQISERTQGLWLSEPSLTTRPDSMVRKGSPVRVRQRALIRIPC